MSSDSVLEKRSFSAYSATPISRLVASANATPTVFRPSCALTRSASTMGFDTTSALRNSRSSTSCRLPGDACLLICHAPLRRPEPSFGDQISMRSCFAVSASRRKLLAADTDSVQDGSPPLSPFFPRYLSTDCVLNTVSATNSASCPCTV